MGLRHDRRCRLPFLVFRVSSLVPSPGDDDVVVVDDDDDNECEEDLTKPSLNPLNSNKARGNNVWYNLRVVTGSKSPQILFLFEPNDLRSVETEVYLAAHSALRR